MKQLTSFLGAFIFHFVFAQQPDYNCINQSPWEDVGPVTIPEPLNPNIRSSTGIGLFNSVCQHPLNPDLLYAASYVSGAFKSIDGGKNWKCITNGYFFGGVYEITVDPTSLTTIYIATGTGTQRDYGRGIWKSTNGGQSFEPTGLSNDILTGEEESFFRVFLHPNNHKEIYAISKTRLFRSKNAGKDFEKLIEDKQGGFRDIEYFDNKFIVAGAKIYVSTNAGKSFEDRTKVLSEITGCSFYRVELDFSVFEKGTFYLFADGKELKSESSKKVIAKSKDFGQSYQIINPNLYIDAGLYKMEFALSTIDSNVIYLGGTYLNKSIDGGKTFKTINSFVPTSKNYFHADVRSMKIYSQKNGIEKLLIGHDGGVTYSIDNAQSFTDISGTGLTAAQFWGFDVSERRDLIVGGTQDCGFHVYENGKWFNPDQYGDSYDCVIANSDPDLIYGVSNGGTLQVQKSIDGGKKFVDLPYISDRHSLSDRPIEINRQNNSIFYVAMSNVWKYDNKWIKISDFANMNVPDGSKIKAMKVSPSNPDYIYVGFENPLWRENNLSGKLFMTSDGGASWTDITAGIEATMYTGISEIEIHPEDPLRVWVVYNMFWQEHKIYESNNGGYSFQSISKNLPNVPVSSVKYLPGSNDAIFVATDLGIYYINNNMSEWACYNINLPNTVITDINLSSCRKMIFVSTFGRGVWKNKIPDDYTFRYDGLKVKNEMILEGPIDAFGDIYIGKKSTLIVKGSLNMPKDSKIFIEKGGKLIVDGGEIKNHCNEKWNGIAIKLKKLIITDWKNNSAVELRNDSKIL